MKRRKWFAVVSVMVASLAVGAGMALAAKTSKSHGKTKAKAQLVTLRCHVTLATQPPAGTNAVPAPVQQGDMYGRVQCSGKHFHGRGVEFAPFHMPDNGDTVSRYVQYFKTGTIKGSFNWAPQEASPVSGTSFQGQTWTGTVTIKGGTGAYKGVKGKKKGVMKCTSPDNVHFSCTEKVRVRMPGGAA